MGATELTRHAAERPEQLAWVVADGAATAGARTYAELDERSSRLAAALRARGLRDDDLVAVLLENVVQYAEVVWAALRSGLRVAPMNVHLTADELYRLLGAAAPAHLVRSVSEIEALLAAAPDRLPEDDESPGARLTYSSGTTGLPKALPEPRPDPPGPGAPLPPPRLQPLMDLLGIGGASVVLSPGPCYHAAPLGFSFTTMRLGGTAMTCAGRFDAQRTLDAVVAHGVTHLHLVPTMLVRMLRLPNPSRTAFARAAAGTLQAVVLGGAPCAPATKAAALDWLGEIVHEYYGASEGIGQTHASPQDARLAPGTVGRPVRGAVRIVDPATGDPAPVGAAGRVVFDRGTAGDLGHLDAHGLLHLDGREGQTVITGGVNVHPQEAEDALLAHPAVLDAGVFGVEDEEYGERLVALVQLIDPPPAGADAAALAAHCRTTLSGPKVPRTIIVTGSVPRSPAGKLLVRAARAHLQEISE